MDTSSTVSNHPSSTSSAAAQTHTIQVGLADHKFKPEVTEAQVGDTVEFRFYPTNHSIVRAEYGYPCIPYEMTGPNKNGFFSGFNAIDKVIDDPPKYTVKINDTLPIFFYCSATGSCINYAMVGVINANSSTPISTQQQLARDSAYMLNPGEPFPPESPLASHPPNASHTFATSKKYDMSPGAIAGIVVAGAAVLVLAALLFFFWGRTKSLKDEVKRNHSRSSSATYILPSSAHTSPATYQYDNAISPLEPYHAHTTHPYVPEQAYRPGLRLVVPTPQPQHASPLLISPVSPHHPSPSGPDRKLGPYGHQEVNGISMDGAGPAPPYGWHVNVSQGPAEMDATPLRTRPRWEEVGASRFMNEGGQF
ncbi:hypothetical protein GQ44DRAFT_768822 [Phaeosphaeriaceae sp. PMI808]|nr:hypothetical protein GQ44DRAFT_768822 [Phaeosphaeriaceae sp. PMI808]